MSPPGRFPSFQTFIPEGPTAPEAARPEGLEGPTAPEATRPERAEAPSPGQRPGYSSSQQGALKGQKLCMLVGV